MWNYGYGFEIWEGKNTNKKKKKIKNMSKVFCSTELDTFLLALVVSC